jgi:CelD/BcsL family acetyltransferase involved in cellulose biosynthesis
LLVAQTVPEIDILQVSWEELYRQQDDATMFQSFQWNRLAATLFQQEQPYVVFLETDGGAALIPAAIRNRRQLCLLGEELFDYRDVLSAGDRCVLSEAWQIVAGSGLPLAQMPVREPAAQKRWSALALTDFCNAPCVSSDLTAEAFASSHTRSGRLMRRLERCGARMAHYPGDNVLLLKQVYAQKAAPSNTWGENLFQDDRRVKFLLTVAAKGPSACRVFTLETPSALVAALVTFEDRGVRRFYTTWFNAMWTRYSPGVALLFEATRFSLAEGLACDYMTGEHDYKLRLATGAVPLCHASGTIRSSRVPASGSELPVAG